MTPAFVTIVIAVTVPVVPPIVPTVVSTIVPATPVAIMASVPALVAVVTAAIVVPAPAVRVIAVTPPMAAVAGHPLATDASFIVARHPDADGVTPTVVAHGPVGRHPHLVRDVPPVAAVADRHRRHMREGRAAADVNRGADPGVGVGNTGGEAGSSEEGEGDAFHDVSSLGIPLRRRITEPYSKNLKVGGERQEARGAEGRSAGSHLAL